MTRTLLKVSSAVCPIFFASPVASEEEVKPLSRRELLNIPGKIFTALEVDFIPGSKTELQGHDQAFRIPHVLSERIFGHPEQGRSGAVDGALAADPSDWLQDGFSPGASKKRLGFPLSFRTLH